MYESNFAMTPVVDNAIQTGKQQVEHMVKNGSEAAAAMPEYERRKNHGD